jgi:hypothetical protein
LFVDNCDDGTNCQCEPYSNNGLIYIFWNNHSL